MHIIIANPGNHSMQFELAEEPFEGQLLHLKHKESSEPSRFYTVTRVSTTPPGLSGVFSFEVTLREIQNKKISAEGLRLPYVNVEEYNN